jgi:hypothetical protein
MRADELGAFRDFLTEALSFWGVQVSDFSLTVWWQAMRAYDIQACKQAFGRHAMNPDGGQFAPKPADVVRMLGGTNQDAALVAWAKVDRAVRSVGTYSDVAFDDALIHRVLHDMGGWIALGTKTEDEWPFVAREFENRYRGYRMRSERPEYPSLLIGMANASNQRSGQPMQPPRLVGDAGKCQAVIADGTDKPMIGFSSAGTLAGVAASGLRLVDGRKLA